MPRTNDLLVAVSVLLFCAFLAPTVRGDVTPVSDSRKIEAEAVALGGVYDYDEASPGVPMADFDEGVGASSQGSCDANGEQGFFIASTGAGQDSFIRPLQISVVAHADATLPDLCQLDTSNGYARSDFEIGFDTDIAYRFIINDIGTSHEPLVQLGDISGASEVLLYDYPGSGNLVYDQVLPPGSYVFRVKVEALEDGDTQDVYAILDFYEVPPAAGAGSVSGLSVGKAGGGDLSLAWQPSCSSDDDDYGIYAGDLGTFTSHTSLQCGTGGGTSATIGPAGGNRYYVVVPLDGTAEGSYGTDSDGFERVVGTSACGTQEIASPCP